MLEPLLAAPEGSTTARAPRLVADRRASAVFVVGAAADYQRVTALVGVLDRDQGDVTTMTAVRLRNARATEVVAALGPLTSGGDDDDRDHGWTQATRDVVHAFDLSNRRARRQPRGPWSRRCRAPTSRSRCRSAAWCSCGRPPSAAGRASA